MSGSGQLPLSFQGDASLNDQAMLLMNALGKHFVAYYKNLADLTGSPKAALMLGHAMFMTRVVMEKQYNRKGGREGWFYKTASDWKAQTGLTVREIESARKVLVGMGILHEKLQGMPAKLWFRVDLDRLAYLLCKFTNTTYRAWSWEDRVIKALLGKPIMFYVPFAWMANSALAGLYMSTLFARLIKSISDKNIYQDGWFLSEINQSIVHLNFGRHALMNAREKLIKAGMIAENREHRAKSRMLTRINLHDLPALIASQASKYHSLSDSDKQGCRNPTFKSSPKRETRVHQNVKQEFTVPQSKSSPNREASSAFTTTLFNKEINTTYPHLHKQPPANIEKARPGLNTASGVGEVDFMNLIFPDKLLPTEKDEAIRLLSHPAFGHIRHQLVLDEWQGQLTRGQIKSNPLGYLRVLAQKESRNELIIEVGHQVQAKRSQRQKNLHERDQARTEQPTMMTPEKLQQRRQQMAALRKNYGW